MTVALAIPAVTIGALGCGGSDDEDATVGGTTATTQRAGGAQAKNPTGEREQAKTGARFVVGTAYSHLASAVAIGVAATDVTLHDTLDAADRNAGLVGFCRSMSEGAKREAISYAKQSSGLADAGWTCPKALALLLRRNQADGNLNRSLKAKVVSVNAEGNRATATIQFGGRGPLSTVPMVREDGDWKLAASP